LYHCDTDKNIISIGILVSGGVLAQANQSIKPEIFGTFDIGVAHLRGDNNITGLATGGTNISRLGLRGNFDIENSPFKVGYWLEMGMNPDTGDGVNGRELHFNRRSTLSLLGNFGELRMGRDDSATFLSTLIFDPFLTNGVGGTMTFMMLGIPGLANAAGGAPIQISNAVSYFLPKDLIKGFSAQLQVASGEKEGKDKTPAVSSKQKNYYGTRLGYTSGAFNSAFAAGRLYGDHKDNDLDIANLAFSYDLKVAKPAVIIAYEKRKNLQMIGSQLGVTVPITEKHLLKASVGHYDKQAKGEKNNDFQKLSLGYGYNFAKSTQGYVQVARVFNNKGSKAVIAGVQGLTAQNVKTGDDSVGIQFGIRHFF